MTAANFDACMPLLKANEGGYANNPADPGGETNWGISKRAYPTLDIRSLTWTDAVAIYRRDYWVPAGCDTLPTGLDWCIMDAAVNSGVHAAIQWLQMAVGANPDGIIGPQTKQAIAACPTVVAIGRMCDARLAFLQKLPTWGEFGAGWMARVNRVRGDALRMAATPVTPTLVDASPAPATVAKPQPQGWLAWARKQVGL